MQKHSKITAQRRMANLMISKLFGETLGTHTYHDYLDLVDERSTAHLAEWLKERVKRTAGEQRRRALFHLEGKTLVISIPVNDTRTERPMWVSLEFSVWLSLIEAGADTAWRLRYKHKDRAHSQVSCSVINAQGGEPVTVAISRLVTGAKGGQRVRALDKDPLNLMRSNLRLHGAVALGSRRSRKNDLEVVMMAAAYRAGLAGAMLGPELLSASRAA